MPRVTPAVARKQAELMAEVRKEEKAQKAAEAAAWAAFKAGGGTLLDEEELAGFLIPLLDADKHKATWKRDGKAHLARLAAEAARPKQVVEIGFPDGGKGPKDADMRPLKWSALRKCFEGTMNIDDARRLARSLGGSVKGDEALPIAAE